MLKAQYATSARFTRNTMTPIVAAHLDGSKPIDSITRVSYNCESIVRIAYTDTTSAFFYSQHSEGNALVFLRGSFIERNAVYHGNSIEQNHHESPSAKSFKRDRDYLFSLATDTYFE